MIWITHIYVHTSFRRMFITETENTPTLQSNNIISIYEYFQCFQILTSKNERSQNVSHNSSGAEVIYLDGGT